MKKKNNEENEKQYGLWRGMVNAQHRGEKLANNESWHGAMAA
jgi:hypothetical protein